MTIPACKDGLPEEVTALERSPGKVVVLETGLLTMARTERGVGCAKSCKVATCEGMSRDSHFKIAGLALCRDEINGTAPA